MTNPVAPPPPASDGTATPPPPGSGAAPVGFPAEKRRGNPLGKVILRIVLALIIGLLVFGVKSFLFGDKAKSAAVGDCIASDKAVAAQGQTKTGAEVVDCGSDKAAFTVVGRVAGETDTTSKSCDRFFAENEQFFVYSSTADGGYLLCLRPKV